MIRKYTDADYNAVVMLWQEAFGDTKEDIDACLYHFAPYLQLYTKQDELLGMFIRLPLHSGKKKGEYIYAVATAKHAQGRGIATTLLNHAKESVISGEIDFLALVPAKPDLFAFYEKRGFTKGALVTRKTYTHRSKIGTDFKIENITSAQMYACRNAHFGKIAAWDEKMLDAIDEIYGCDCYYTFRSDTANGVCMAYISGGKLIVPELLLDGTNTEDALDMLNSYFGTEEIIAVLPDRAGEAFAMFYPSEYKDHYFNLAIN